MFEEKDIQKECRYVEEKQHQEYQNHSIYLVIDETFFS